MIRKYSQINWLPADRPIGTEDIRGLHFKPVEQKEFDTFILRHATSPELGRIGTVYDQKEPTHPNQIIRTLGLYGCNKLCAIALCVIIPNRSDSHKSCRLDTLVSDNGLRQQGLATSVVAALFKELLLDPELDISRMFSYAVHPGTVAALKKMHFSNPPPKGAPLISVEIGDPETCEVLSSCQELFTSINAKLSDTCSKCTADDEPERRWCEPPSSTPNE